MRIKEMITKDEMNQILLTSIIQENMESTDENVR